MEQEIWNLQSHHTARRSVELAANILATTHVENAQLSAEIKRLAERVDRLAVKLKKRADSDYWRLMNIMTRP